MPDVAVSVTVARLASNFATSGSASSEDFWNSRSTAFSSIAATGRATSMSMRAVPVNRSCAAAGTMRST
jgi:hypothetical protein